MKRRGVGGREVTSFRGEIKKLASQRKNERDLTIYTEQMLYLQKSIFNIRIRRLTIPPFSDNFMQTMPPRQKTW